MLVLPDVVDQVYVPCTLIVVLSWVGFWLNREATSDRVGLGVTAVLTLSTIALDSRTGLPKVFQENSSVMFVSLLSGSLRDCPGLVYHLQFPLLYGLAAGVRGCSLLHQGRQRGGLLHGTGPYRNITHNETSAYLCPTQVAKMRDEGRWPGGREEDEEEEEVEQVEDWSESSPAGSTETTDPRDHTRRNQHRFQFRLLAQQARV